ncbi:MAG: transposase [Pyrinomonadaceae bacterium]
MDKRHTRYAREFKKEAVRKAMMRGPRTLAEVAGEMGVGLNTLKTWMRLDREKIRGRQSEGKSPEKGTGRSGWRYLWGRTGWRR